MSAFDAEITELMQRLAQATELLRDCSEKLHLYYQHDQEYRGGKTYQSLRQRIDAFLKDAHE